MSEEPRLIDTCDSGDCDKPTIAIVRTVEDGWLSMCHRCALNTLTTPQPQPLNDLDTDLATDIAEQEISAYVREGLATADTGDVDRQTIAMIRGLHLAQPWLPALEITTRMRAAGLLALPR